MNWVKRQFASNIDRGSELVVFGLYGTVNTFLAGLLDLLDHLVYAIDNPFLRASRLQS